LGVYNNSQRTILKNSSHTKKIYLQQINNIFTTLIKKRKLQKNYRTKRAWPSPIITSGARRRSMGSVLVGLGGGVLAGGGADRGSGAMSSWGYTIAGGGAGAATCSPRGGAAERRRARRGRSMAARSPEEALGRRRTRLGRIRGGALAGPHARWATCSPGEELGWRRALRGGAGRQGDVLVGGGARRRT
jgi:hypothetical protein